MTRNPDDVCIDACPDCPDRNPTLPRELLAESPSSVTFEYRCSAGHEWTCAWADPAWTASVPGAASSAGAAGECPDDPEESAA